MAKRGQTYYIDTELTAQQYIDNGFPALYYLKSENKIIKIFAFDLHGVRADFGVDMFPQGGNVGDVLVLSADGKTWSSRLTNVETTKLDKPTTDGIWLVKKVGETLSWVKIPDYPAGKPFN